VVAGGLLLMLLVLMVVPVVGGGLDVEAEVVEAVVCMRREEGGRRGRI